MPGQAKVYVGPGRQRHLGSFATELEAAKAIYWWRVSGDKLNSPKKDRNKRGEGRRKRDRRKGAGRLPSLAFTSVLICCACLLAHRSHFAAQDCCRDDKVKDTLALCGVRVSADRRFTAVRLIGGTFLRE